MYAKIFLALAPLLWYMSVASAGIIQEGPLTKADYWVKQNPDGEQVLLDAAGIQAYNEKVLQSDQKLLVVDLAAFPQLLDGKAVRKTLPIMLICGERFTPAANFLQRRSGNGCKR